MSFSDQLWDLTRAGAIPAGVLREAVCNVIVGSATRLAASAAGEAEFSRIASATRLAASATGEAEFSRIASATRLAAEAAGKAAYDAPTEEDKAALYAAEGLWWLLHHAFASPPRHRAIFAGLHDCGAKAALDAILALIAE